MKGSKSEIELNPKQFLRGVRMALIATSNALQENPTSLRVSFIGWLKAGNNSFPSENEIDNWGIPIPDLWNDENAEEEMGLKSILDSIAGTRSRAAKALGVQSTNSHTTLGTEGIFVEATSEDVSVDQISSKIGNADPSLLENKEGYKYLIEPVGEGMTVEDKQPMNVNNNSSKTWLYALISVLGALCAGGVGVAILKTRSSAENVNELSFCDFEQNPKEELQEAQISVERI